MFSFEANIERKITDNVLKLNYLIQYCSGEPRDLISDCIILGNNGYARAVELLSSRYGKPHMVAQAHVQKLINGPVIKPNDVKALSQLSLDMTRAEMTLSQLGYVGEINSSSNLRCIVNRLPHYLQTKWVERAYTITESGTMVSFSHLTKFIEERMQVANSLYGLNLVKQNGEKFKSKPKGKATAFASVGSSGTNTESKVRKCWCCKGACEKLESCEKFRGLSLDERKKYVRKNRLCDNCFGYKHMAKSCYKDSLCTEPNCGLKHNVLLHDKRSSVVADVDVTQNNTCSAIEAGQKVCLRILPVRVVNGSVSVDTYALLDAGSDVTLCDEKLVSKLRLPKKRKTYTINTVNQSKVINGSEVDLTVCSADGRESVSIPKAWSISKLPISLNSLPSESDINKWPHLKGIPFPEINANEVMLLIGSDSPEVFWSLEERRGDRKQPYAVRSILGWTILGPVSQLKREGGQVNVHFQQAGSDVIQQQLQAMWNLEFSDHSTPAKSMSIEDKRAYETMQATTKLVDGHYEMSLPWRCDKVQLPNNRFLAVTRLESLRRKLSRDKGLHEKYKLQVETYIDKGYAVKVSNPESGSPKVWYLPHHAVTNPNKPGKVRVVFDCAAKYRGVSLNDQLLHGPDLVNSLTGVLIKFRQEPIAVMADIEGMFNQVRVTPEDCDALRFLWWPNGDLDKEPEEFKMVVHLFGATSSPSCSTYALKRTAKDNVTSYSSEAIATVERNFYVDDLLKSVENPSQAITLVAELCALLRVGGFRLTKWTSNNKEVLESIPNAEKAPSVVDLAFDDDLPTERALGVKWDVQRDQFVFNVSRKDKPVTRRGILSVVAALYDPLGFVVPITLHAKLLLQRLCRDGVDWDDTLATEDGAKWQQWLEDLQCLLQLRIPRCFKPQNFVLNGSELHFFCDASEYGYGACAYLRLSGLSGEVAVNLVIGKSRLAPIKHITIPRLELSAAALACRLNEIVAYELEIKVNRAVFWTDSMVVLGYIRNTRSRFKTFVANRLTAIHDSTTPEQWRYVPTSSNPADVASRGIRATDKKNLKFWLHGPEFLSKEESVWPSVVSQVSEVVDDCEVKKTSFAVESDTSPQVIDLLIGYYSKWFKLRKACAWLLRFKLYCLQKFLRRNVELSTDHLSIGELNTAADLIIQHVQGQEFSQEVIALKSGRQVATSSKLASLAPFLRNGTIHVGGRLRNSSLPFSQSHQIILPQRHTVTTLILREIHMINGHVGARQMLTVAREKYWIVSGLQACKSIVTKCISCLRRKGQPVTQMMGDLPAERLTPDKPPFTFVGVDFFGPYLVRFGRGSVKRYCCLFTCLTSRAVHIEVCHSLNTDSFIGAVTRLISRRGKPEKIFSDNGTNFKAGEQELRSALSEWNQKQINDYLLQRQIEWNFNPPHASHMGGIWERLIRSIRQIMRALTNQQVLNDEALTTFMAEIERILNNRPITYTSTDHSDPKALTPSMILLLRDTNSLPYGTFSKEDLYIRRWWRQAQYLANVFWRRWLKEYVPSLQLRDKWQRPCKNIRINDLVLMLDENTPRGQWPLAIVKDVKYGRDGLVRSCKVKAGASEYVRPVHKLCLLEASE